MADIPEKREFKKFDLLVPTLDEQGPTHVFESDLQAWLDENQDMRPEGSGPNFEWTIGDEAAAVGNLERAQELAKNDESGEMQARLDEFPMDVLADMLGDDGYDFSPEGAEARQQAYDASIQEVLDRVHPIDTDRETWESLGETVDDGTMLTPEEAREMLTEYQKSQDAEEASTPETSSRQYPNKMNRTITHPDGFVEFDQHVFEDPERDKIMGNTWQALRRLSAKRAFEQEEAKRKGRQDPASTLGPSMTE